MLVANKRNLKTYAEELLSKEYTPENEKVLIDLCTKKSVDDYNKGHHISFAIRDYLEDIDKVLHTFGVESLYPEFDLEYCNTGDIYNMTIFYYKGKLRIGDIGSILEK